MNAFELIEQAHQSGVRLELSDNGNIRILGDEDAIERLIPAFREHKPEILAMLQGRQERAMHLAKLAIARAALTDDQKQSRLADIEREPGIAPFWANIEINDQRNGLTE